MMFGHRNYVRPEGTLQLSRRVLHVHDSVVADEAAREMCRRCPVLDTLPALIAEWFPGEPTPVLFDRLADAHDQVSRERALDALDQQLTEGAPA